VLAKLNYSNAFNCIHRDAILLDAHDKLPEIFNFFHPAYAQYSFLDFGNFQILSEEGFQQDDPQGPSCFVSLYSLCFHLSSLLSQLVLWMTSLLEVVWML
jgi:hypothetical protein